MAIFIAIKLKKLKKYQINFMQYFLSLIVFFACVK
jgi:hypothetical protein